MPVMAAISLGHLLGKADRRVEAGADGRAALGQFACRPGSVSSMRLIAVGDLRGIAGEFLAERQRRGVLGVGAADLDDVVEGLGLGFERRMQVLQRRQQVGGRSRSAQAMCMAVG